MSRLILHIFISTFVGLRAIATEVPSAKQQETGAQCLEQLAIPDVPSSCYAGALSSEEVQFLDRLCRRVAPQIQSFDVLHLHLTNTKISEDCFEAMMQRGEVLAYKLEFAEPLKSYLWSRKLAGLRFETSRLHAATKSK